MIANFQCGLGILHVYDGNEGALHSWNAARLDPTLAKLMVLGGE
jgi:hypothetical protein